MRKAFVAMLAASCSSAAVAGEPGWIVSEISGSVQIARAGTSKVATRGIGISAGDTVSTGPGGRAVLVRGSEYLMVAANSRLRLPEAQQANGFTQLFEDFGNVVFMIKKKMTPHFEVKTPYLAAVVKGTTFSVGVTAAGASVQVLEGAVDVATVDNGAHELLRPGAVAQVGANDLYRLAVESDGVRRVIASPAAPTAPVMSSPAASAETPAADAAAPAAVAAAPPATVPAPSAPPAPPSAAVVPPSAEAAVPKQAAIVAAVYEAPVSLATVTGGLVTGMSGANISDVSTATRVAAEASNSVVKAVEIASNSTAGDAVKDKTTQSVVAVVERATATAAKADTDKSKSGADVATATAAADQVAKDAADKAAQDAAKAASDQASKDAAKAADQAAKDSADKAAQDAAKAASNQASKDAAKAADQAAKDATDKAAQDAAKAASDKAAKDAAKAADQAAKDAADKAAQDTAKAASDKAAKDAEKAADQAAKDAADKAAQDTGKAASDKAAKDAAKAADQAAKDAAKAASG